MKKDHFTVMSTLLCSVLRCDRSIKMNVARRIKRRPLMCYYHWKANERVRRTRPA